MTDFELAYAALNPEQKKAVDTIDGPVMVIAGPGTGKTQVLALRIAKILVATDTPPDGVLCLTFTNAGVKAMRERLVRLIGPTATKIKISTFHGYGLELIQEYFAVLGFDSAPTLLDDSAAIALFDDVLYSRQWQYLRPRSNAALYYNDLKALISRLKRDGVSPADFAEATRREIEHITTDPDQISSRGETKGQLKKDAQKRIESLERTLEAAAFYEAYQALKHERHTIDFNDVLTLMVAIVCESEEVGATIRERFLYVLIDEHQDSTGIQNAFLQELWGDEERPNLFVVGDDRQLIYGFGGASLAYFEAFKHTFGTAALITLTHNYRSTQLILDAAESLLRSTLAEGALIGQEKGTEPLKLVECGYPRDEIIAAGMAIKEKIAHGLSPDACAILVPKNRQVKTVVTILEDLGIEVAAGTALSLFELPDTESLCTVFKIICDPYDGVAIAASLLDPVVGISALVAHHYLYESDTRALSVEVLCQASDPTVKAWGEQLAAWLTLTQSSDAYQLIQVIGDTFLLQKATADSVLRRRVEIIRTLLHMAMAQIEHSSPEGRAKATLGNFMAFIERLKAYGEDVPLAVFGANKGVKVLTLHGSKGLEFDFVWIAHMDERSLMSGKRGGFVLPQDSAHDLDEEEMVAKRKLYVAITRAKQFCTLSYAHANHAGSAQTLASIIEALPIETYVTQELVETEMLLVQGSMRDYVAHVEPALVDQTDQRAQLVDVVATEYADKKISVTMLNNFFECPWKWYFRNLLQLPQALTESLQVGNVTHKTIEYLLAQKDTSMLAETINRYAMLEARHDEILALRISSHVNTIIEQWRATYYPTLTEIYQKEQSLTYIDPLFQHLTITGKIDLVEELAPGTVRVTDWKTGSSKTKADIEKRDDTGHMSGLLRQLAMYSYLLEGVSGGSTKVIQSRLVFLEAKVGDKHSVQVQDISAADIEQLRADIAEYDQSLSSGVWVNRPCAFKAYGAQDVCQYCARAKVVYAALFLH